MADENKTHFTCNAWEAIRTPLEWKNFMDDLTEGGCAMTNLEIELYHDYAAMAEFVRRDPQNSMIKSLEHERGLLREALNANMLELEALALRNRKFLDLSPNKPSCIEGDRADSDPKRKE